MDDEPVKDDQQQHTEYDTRDPEAPVVLHHIPPGADHQHADHKYERAKQYVGIAFNWLWLAVAVLWRNVLWNRGFWLFASTVTMAVAAALYTHYASKQLSVMSGTLAEARRSGQQSTEQVWRAIDNLNWAARSMDAAVKESKQQFDDTLTQMRAQTKAQLRSSKIAGDTLRITQRSNVSIGRKDGVIGRFYQNPSGGDWEIRLYFQNSGHTPAMLAWGTDTGRQSLNARSVKNGTIGDGRPMPIIYNRPFKGMWKIVTKTTITNYALTSVPIPGESVIAVPFFAISDANLKELKTKVEGALIWGRYQYCDELGTETTHDFAVQFTWDAEAGDNNFSVSADRESSSALPKGSFSLCDPKYKK